MEKFYMWCFYNFHVFFPAWSVTVNWAENHVYAILASELTVGFPENSGIEEQMTSVEL